MEVDKQRIAGDIVHQALTNAIRSCQPGTSIRSICLASDQQMQAAFDLCFQKYQDMEKGIAYPTCVMVNNGVSGWSPMPNDDQVLAEGDLVKIELGGHIDGHIATQAHTFVCGSFQPTAENPLQGRVADVVCAAYMASEVVLRMLKPGTTNIAILHAIKRVADAFHCRPVEGACVYQTKRFVMLSPAKSIEVEYGDKEEFVIPSEEWNVLPDEYYTVNICMTTASTPKVKPSHHESAVFQHNVLRNQYELRLNSSRKTFRYIQDTHSVFPFSVSSWETQLRAGLPEIYQNGLLTAVPSLKSGIAGDHVAQFKYCANIALDGQQVKMTPSNGLSLPYVKSAFSLPSDLADLLKEKVKSVKTSQKALLTESAQMDIE